jgi:hypothetical protein
MALLLDHLDPARGKRVKIERDKETGLPIFTHSQDPAAIRRILSSNKEQSNHLDHAALARKNTAGMVKVASIPSVVVAHLMRIGMWNDKQAVMRWLDQPENRWLRTDGGRRLT